MLVLAQGADASYTRDCRSGPRGTVYFRYFTPGARMHSVEVTQGCTCPFCRLSCRSFLVGSRAAVAAARQSCCTAQP
jgi:hypothetical protein